MLAYRSSSAIVKIVSGLKEPDLEPAALWAVLAFVRGPIQFASFSLQTVVVSRIASAESACVVLLFDSECTAAVFVFDSVAAPLVEWAPVAFPFAAVCEVFSSACVRGSENCDANSVVALRADDVGSVLDMLDVIVVVVAAALLVVVGIGSSEHMGVALSPILL